MASFNMTMAPDAMLETFDVDPATYGMRRLDYGSQLTSAVLDATKSIGAASTSFPVAEKTTFPTIQ